MYPHQWRWDSAFINLRRVPLKALAKGGFAEHFEPFTGEALSSDGQSWTAAVTLDWLADSA